MSEPSGQPDGYLVLSYLIAGGALYGGLGWLLDRFLHVTFLLPVGLVLGFGLAVFLIVKRFGNR